MNLVLLGQPFWTARLASLIRKHATGPLTVHDLGAGRRPTFGALQSLAAADTIVRVGFRPNANTPRGRMFDLVWRLIAGVNRSAVLATYWIGTDVERAVAQENARPSARRDMLAPARSIHIVGAPWFVDDLKSIGITPTLALFPGEVPTLPENLSLPAAFTVVTYIPDSRHDYYGSAMLLQAARTFPTVQFRVVGGRGTWMSDPLPNVHFLGWQPDMATVYEGATVVARLVQHDAFGGSAREALFFARHLIYTQRVPHSYHVAFGDNAGLELVLGQLLSLHDRGELTLNLEGQAYALREFDEATLTRGLIDTLCRPRMPRNG